MKLLYHDKNNRLNIRQNSLSDVGLDDTEVLVDDGVDATFTGFDKLPQDDISLSLPKKHE